jgi:hypothetical protein
VTCTPARRRTCTRVAHPEAVFGAAAPKGNYADLATKGWELALGWQDGFHLVGKPGTYGIHVSLSTTTRRS